MATTQAILSIAVILISFLSGFLLFYLISPLAKEAKKKHMEEMLSLIINFILFIWLGKIIKHLSIFIRDPIAVLAYPSDSTAFYIAVLLISIHMVYKVIRHSFAVKPILHSFIPVFLMANFVYEFIQNTWFDRPYAWAHMTLLVILLLIYILLLGRKPNYIFYLFAFLWVIGQLSLAYLLPFTTIFHYILAPWFLWLLLLAILLWILFYERKRVS